MSAPIGCEPLDKAISRLLAWLDQHREYERVHGRTPASNALALKVCRKARELTRARLVRVGIGERAL